MDETTTPVWDAMDPSETDALEYKARCSQTAFVHIVSDHESYLCGIGRLWNSLLDHWTQYNHKTAIRCQPCVDRAKKLRLACEPARTQLQIEKGYRFSV